MNEAVDVRKTAKAAEPILEIENLSISFFTRAGEIPAVMDFSCKVMPGEAESAAAVLAKVETAVQTHLAGDEAADDLTMLGLRRLGSISNL